MFYTLFARNANAFRWVKVTVTAKVVPVHGRIAGVKVGPIEVMGYDHPIQCIQIRV